MTKPHPNALMRLDDVSLRSLEHTVLERWADRALAMTSAMGLPFTKLDPEGILASARRSTRLEDFGDSRFHSPLRQAMEVVDKGPYTPLGRAFIRGTAVRIAQNRLRIEQWFKEHPQTSEIPIRRPIFVLGFPRSGTTLLQNLLEQAPDRRALRFWELTNPVPEHEDASRDRVTRVRRAARDLAWAYRFVPEMEEMHDARPDSAEECWPLLATTFAVLNFDICHGFRSYGDWLMGYDMRWAYGEYKRQLQLLSWREPVARLILKCPEHLWFLDALLTVFPDACIVWTHRDPVDSIASYSSLISLSRRTLQGRIDPSLIGPHIAERFEEGVRRAMKVRDRVGDDSRFFDVSFEDLVADPVALTNRIEEHFGLDLSDRKLLEAWLAQKRADGPGRHRYRADMWGLHPEVVHKQFADYIDRFGVQTSV